MKHFLYKVGILLIFYRLCVLNVLDAQAVEMLFHNQNNKIQMQMHSEPIISGSVAALGQFPWHVILRRNENDALLCGGSIISNNWVLTAGHCLYNISSVFLMFGTIDLFKYDIKMTSSKFYTYPDFDVKNFIHDISLIELPTPLNFTKNIQPIKLVSSAEASNKFVGVECIIMGFGKTDDAANDTAKVLQWGTVEIIDNTICAKAYGDERMEDTIMCGVGYNNSKMTTCDGDSGGSLVWNNIQIDITSFTVKNMCSKYPPGFTRVTSYLNYIQNITGINFS
ncbi:collagenase-like [Lucilia sericata]|uniref:collagenase-like n=1 Tax=Lucilia sericata TaxID=13632 RepID=UPI0018A836CE|nr:collagenase-like [Lucilia sericata]